MPGGLDRGSRGSQPIPLQTTDPTSWAFWQSIGHRQRAGAVHQIPAVDPQRRIAGGAAKNRVSTKHCGKTPHRHCARGSESCHSPGSPRKPRTGVE
jgi:hypothetical protein